MWNVLRASVDLKAPLPVLLAGLTTVTEYGGECPYQAEGFLADGRSWYFRYRFGRACLMYPEDPPLMLGARPRTCVLYGQEFDGFLNDVEAACLWVHLARQLDPRPGELELVAEPVGGWCGYGEAMQGSPGTGRQAASV